MLRTLLCLLFLVILLIIAFFICLIGLFCHDKKPGAYPSPIIQWTIDFFAPIALKIAGASFIIEGTENLPKDGETVFFAGNHQGDFDLFIPLCFVGKKMPAIIAKKQVLKVPVVNMFMYLCNDIFMDRGNLRKSLECINKATEELKAGRSVLVFPEGTRSKGPDMRDFKAGCFKAALESGRKVVPFAIDGTYKLFEEKHLLRRGSVRLAILPPVDPKNFKSTKDLSKFVQEQIRQKQEEMRQ